jgi:hypothetical protein
MSKIEFERHITRFEVLNQTILIEDDQGNDHGIKFPSTKLMIRTPDRTYNASLRDFYVGNKFKPGIAFDHEEGHLNEFFFDHSVSENKRAKLAIDPNEPLIDGCTPVDLSVYVITR